MSHDGCFVFRQMTVIMTAMKQCFVILVVNCGVFHEVLAGM